MIVTKEDVAGYLADVKKAVRKKRYTISPREKNEKIFKDYLFTEKMQENIILSLEVEDFSKAEYNEHTRFGHEILYVFGKNVKLLPRFGGDERIVALYIKFNKLENQYCIVVSFHEQEYNLKYAFK